MGKWVLLVFDGTQPLLEPMLTYSLRYMKFIGSHEGLLSEYDPYINACKWNASLEVPDLQTCCNHLTKWVGFVSISPEIAARGTCLIAQGLYWLYQLMPCRGPAHGSLSQDIMRVTSCWSHPAQHPPIPQTDDDIAEWLLAKTTDVGKRPVSVITVSSHERHGISRNSTLYSTTL